MAVTTNYSWTKPDVAGSSGTWGTTLNTDLDSIDTQVKAVSDAATTATTNAAAAQATANLAYAGNQQMPLVTLTMAGTTPNYTCALDLSLGTHFYVVANNTTGVTHNLKFTLSNRPATYSRIIYVRVERTGGGSGGIMSLKVASGQGAWALQAAADSFSPGNDAWAAGSFGIGEVCVVPVLIVGS